jgi:hypothetical protein
MHKSLARTLLRQKRHTAPPLLSLAKIAQTGEIVEALRRLRILGAEHLLADRQRITKQRLGLCIGSSPVGNRANLVRLTLPWPALFHG